jgi:ATP-dependent exoDNAse (exonuclease V) beta subunit
MTAERIPDAAERERALDPAHSFIVQAPAGSGKTELLIQRYLRLLAAVDEPEEIVAITFTLKAAGEMRGRVLAALAAARARTAPAGEHAVRTRALAEAVARRDEGAGWRIGANPARLRIETIDALCLGLARQMPTLSAFGVPPVIVEDAAALYRDAARATLDRVESSDEVAAAVAHLLAHLDNDVARVGELLAGMLARRDHWIRHLRRLDRPALETALASERERAVARVRALYPRAPADGPDGWQTRARELLTKTATWRKASPTAQALAGLPDGERLREALAALLEIPPATYADAQWEALAAIGRLLPHALAELKVA